MQFSQLIESYYQRYQKGLNLSYLSFRKDGFVEQAILKGLDGSVEILYGPPEYHAEILVNSIKNKKHWNLADLAGIESVRDWLVRYSKKASVPEQSSLEAEIEWIFLILTDGLKGVAGFEWIQKDS